LTLVTDL